MKYQQEKITADLFTTWSQSERGEGMARGHDELLNPLFQQWEFGAESNVLDIGCGVGGALKRANQNGANKLAGIDLSPGMIEAARNNLPENASLEVGSAMALPWSNDFFSHALSVEALYYLQEPLLALKEIIRVLKSKGEFAMIIEFYQENQGTHDWANQLPMELKLWSEKEWVNAFEEAGFQNVKTKRIIREKFKSQEEFIPSTYYPDYSNYLDYIKEGALWVHGVK